MRRVLTVLNLGPLPLTDVEKVAIVEDFLDSGALTCNSPDGTPDMHSVHPSDVPFMVNQVLAAASRVRQLDQ